MTQAERSRPGTVVMDGLIEGPVPLFEDGEERLRQWVSETTAAGITFHLTIDGPRFSLGKGVGVYPQGVRPTQLHVDEATGRVPLGDPRMPAEGHAEETQLVVEQCAEPHVQGHPRQNPETELGRCDALEILGSREKEKDRFEREP